MGFRSSVAAFLVILLFICHSHKVSASKVPLLSFHDGYAITMILSSAAFEGDSSIQGVINPNATVTVYVDATSVKNATFMIFQVHSYVNPLVLSLAPALVNGEHVNGTDLGLYSKLNGKAVTYYIINHHTEPVSLMLVPMLYGKEDPVPGGCNLSFPVSIAPFMTLTYHTDNEIVQVDAQAAAIQDQPDCKPLGLAYEVYELDLFDTSVDSYFHGIISMLTAKSAELRGLQTRKPIHQPELRRRFASYPGFGAIYVVTVRDLATGKSSAYVPIAKYGCIEGNDENCYTYATAVWVMSICAIIFIMAEIRFYLGANMKLLVRTAFTLGTIITLEPALPPYLSWTLLGFLCLAFVVLCVAGQLGQALNIFTEHAYALVPAHICLGLSLYGGLGMVSGFQDWLVVIYSFGIYFLVFYILGRLLPETDVEPLYGFFFNVALVSAITNGMVFYVYVDPSRILRQDFSDVIFTPPTSLTDHLLVISVPLLFAAYAFARRAIQRRLYPRDYLEIETAPPPYSPHSGYRSM